MILTNCAACAAPLAHNAPRCVRCKVRYCNQTREKVLDERWNRWHTCGLCKQDYHGVVACALGWACDPYR